MNQLKRSTLALSQILTAIWPAEHSERLYKKS